ncbi:MAG: hypothetical protein JXK05_01690 [Campylobacterales bacterium]|nr:hypothetical protein [Campylobacterales bacterium]
MVRFIAALILAASALGAFESSNIQLLYSQGFKGDSFAYDTRDGAKTTLTFEHFRTFEAGDLFMFVDYADGTHCFFEEGECAAPRARNSVYSEISPRISLSKLSRSDLVFGPFKDLYLAAQYNAGHDFTAYMAGIGTDLDLPGFAFCSLNLYHRSFSAPIEWDSTYQLSLAYASQPFWGLTLEGFVDLTGFDRTAHTQLLYTLEPLGAKGLFLGGEWIHYRFDKRFEGFRIQESTDVLQAMAKYRF